MRTTTVVTLGYCDICRNMRDCAGDSFRCLVCASCAHDVLAALGCFEPAKPIAPDPRQLELKP